MFTGVIRDRGVVQSIDRLGSSYKLTIKSETLKNVNIGDSIAVDGTCLTVTTQKGDLYSFDISFESLKKTAFANYKNGTSVHLEQALQLSSRLDGHIVQGHVDTVGKIDSMIKRDTVWEIEITVLDEFSKFLVPSGSISVNGVSLTLASANRNIFRLVVIPHSFKETNFSKLNKGDLVNIEFDYLVKTLYHFQKNRR
ncbi:riboflavin synthase [bacterium]|nr:riboflavin synthase [bacterium]